MLLYWVHIYLESLALLSESILLPLCMSFVSFDLCCFKVYFIRDENCNSCFSLLSTGLVILPPSLYFEPLCILACEMSFLDKAHRWVWLFIQFVSLCLLIGAFSLFTFRVNIVMCEFNPVILMLAGCFAH